MGTIFESFGTAVSTFNDTASCLGQFQTLQFNERGRIIGCETSIFLFDKYRISRTHIQQYNIFYQLLAGTTPDEKQALHITHNHNFHYLRQSNQRDQQRDLIHFNHIKDALKVCGFKTKTVAQMCQLLAAILHLGNIQFVDGKFHFTSGDNPLFSSNTGGGTSNSSTGGHESCRIKNKETLALVAAALGVATSKLETALTHKVKLIGNEFCTAFLTPDIASEQRDALAQTLYTAMILWMTNVLNQKLAVVQPVNDSDETIIVKTISILDSVGFQLENTQRASTFHDICVNYAIERLYQYCFDRHISPDAVGNAELAEDHIWPSHLPLLLHPPSALQLYHGTNKNNFALIPLINKESRRFQTYALDATDSNLLSLLFQKKRSTNNNDYKTLLTPSTPSYSFAIRHFSDAVSTDYSIDGFLESNLGAISPDFVHMFRYNCTNTFVHALFEPNSLVGWVTDIHPRDERTVIKAQLPTWSQPPSKKKKKIHSVLDQVVQGVNELIEILNHTPSLFEILHIKPNDQLKPDLFDPALVQQQLHALRVVEIAAHTSHIDRLHGYTQHALISRYKPIMEAYIPLDEDDTVVDDGDSIAEWIRSMQWTPKNIRFGESKVWLSFELWRSLENQIRTMEKEVRLREKARLAAAMEAETEEALRQAAIAAAIEAEEVEAAAAAAAAAEAEVDDEPEEYVADRWSSCDKNPFADDDCRSDMSNEEDSRTEIDTHLDPFGKKSEWGDDDEQRFSEA